MKKYTYQFFLITFLIFISIKSASAVDKCGVTKTEILQSLQKVTKVSSYNNPSDIMKFLRRTNSLERLMLIGGTEIDSVFDLAERLERINPDLGDAREIKERILNGIKNRINQLYEKKGYAAATGFFDEINPGALVVDMPGYWMHPDIKPEHRKVYETAARISESGGIESLDRVDDFIFIQPLNKEYIIVNYNDYNRGRGVSFNLRQTLNIKNPSNYAQHLANRDNMLKRVIDSQLLSFSSVKNPLKKKMFTNTLLKLVRENTDFFKFNTLDELLQLMNSGTEKVMLDIIENAVKNPPKNNAIQAIKAWVRIFSENVTKLGRNYLSEDRRWKTVLIGLSAITVGYISGILVVDNDLEVIIKKAARDAELEMSNSTMKKIVDMFETKELSTLIEKIDYADCEEIIPILVHVLYR